MCHKSLWGWLLHLKKNVLISALRHWGRLEIDSRGIFKRGRKWAGEKTYIILGKMKVSILILIICFADHWEKGKGSRQISFFFSPRSFHFCYTSYLCNSVIFPLFWFFVCFSYFPSSLHMGSENSEERQATYLGFLGQQPLQPSHLPSL